MDIDGFDFRDRDISESGKKKAGAIAFIVLVSMYVKFVLFEFQPFAGDSCE